MEYEEKERAKQIVSYLRWVTQDREIQEKEGKAEVAEEVGRDGSHSKRRMQAEETVRTSTTHQKCNLLG